MIAHSDTQDAAASGVLDSPEIPGGCFSRYAGTQMPGFRTLSPGQRGDLVREAPVPGRAGMWDSLEMREGVTAAARGVLLLAEGRWATSRAWPATRQAYPVSPERYG